MRVLIAAGGTGGHIYPGLTIANEIKRRFPKGEIVFVGTEYGLEKDIIPRAGYQLELIAVQYFRRKLSLDTIKTGMVALRGVTQSLALVKNFRPDVVVGTGGYVAGPVLLAAAMRRVPTLIQEQNALPGATSRILGRFVKSVALGYQEAVQFFPKSHGIIVTGNPIRQEIIDMTKREAINTLRLDPTLRTVVVFGGSQGGLSINRAMGELAPRLNQTNSLQVIHQTGQKTYPEIAKEVLARTGMPVTSGFPEMVQDGCIQIVPYIHNMPAALAAADLVVGRAGAISLAEIAARGLPAILIPFPHAAANHQEKNARVFEQAGAARVLLDGDVNGQSLGDLIFDLLDNPGLLRSMAMASKSLGKTDATKTIVNEIEILAKQRSS
ncbi:MAG: undecaprenyldiphospho-muramoylpentapeptide beta-N-acetylglucosaminyltransferase [Firmicutes bacterium]|nr:undecaprenyldiphospho-muramoylpentapeptide beta-N-acetylglucosaminyltransferase [Bacillota bacterium]